MLTLVKNYYNRYYQFWYWVLRRFYADGCMVRASALTYTTLLSLVPLMVVIISALSLFPFFDQASLRVQDFIFSNFVPHTGDQVQQVVMQVESQASNLPAFGFVFLFITAIMLMFNIDKTLNDLFKPQVTRKMLNSLLMYWALLTIGPFFLGSSLAISSYLQSLRWLHITGFTEFSVILTLVPFVLNVAAFTFFYVIVPHGEVKLKHGLAGAVFASVLFEIAKRAFSYYVVVFPTYKLLYGALATIPLFLVWVYVSWLIFLLGAELVNALKYQQAFRSEHEMPHLALAFLILYEAWYAQKQKKVLAFDSILARVSDCNISQLKKIISRLCELDYLVVIGKDTYALKRDLHDLYPKTLITELGYYCSAQQLSALASRYQQLQELATIMQAGEDSWNATNKPLSQIYKC